MIKNYFKTAFRHISRHKLFSVINISGLAIGISASLIIYLIVDHELGYEKFQKDYNRIYRVVSEMKFPGMIARNSGVPVPTVKATRDEVTGLETVTHFYLVNPPTVSIKEEGGTFNNYKKQKDIVYADEYYFNMFSYQWLAGSAPNALQESFHVVLTESRAKTYFGSLSPGEIIGKEIIYNDSIKTTVSGIVRDIDAVTDFTFKEFISRATVEHTGLKDKMAWGAWGSNNGSSQMFVKLKNGIAPSTIEKQLVLLRKKYNVKKAEDKSSEDPVTHFLQPLRDIHFNQNYGIFNQRASNKSVLWGLLTVACFLLVLGCINFINLMTAQSSLRAKEIGIKKTMGSGKTQVILQFLSEALLLAILSTILSIAIFPFLLNVFQDFIPEGISFQSILSGKVIMFLAILTLAVSVLAGWYPALMLAKFRPVTALKNQAYEGGTQTRKAWVRKTLIITQFIIAQFLVIATLVVNKQISFSLHSDMGFRKDAIITIDLPANFYSTTPDTRNILLYDAVSHIHGISKASLGGAPPSNDGVSSNSVSFDEGKGKVQTMAQLKYGDTAYLGLYEMKLLAGRNLRTNDSLKEYIVNETMIKTLGFSTPDEAIGHFIKDGEKNIPIAGVVSDFHTASTHEPIKPLIFSKPGKSGYTLHLALAVSEKNNGGWPKTIGKVEAAFNQLYPEGEFSYKFFDETVASLYNTEQRISRLLTWASGLCIFISCLGLLGLVIYITNTRTREIGVRKILGARVVQIVSLLSKEFISLVFIAFVIAVPLSWWAMYNWLQDFAYRTALSWWLFVITGIGMLIIALFILSIRTIQSASVNPVKSLRTE